MTCRILICRDLLENERLKELAQQRISPNIIAQHCPLFSELALHTTYENSYTLHLISILFSSASLFDALIVEGRIEVAGEGLDVLPVVGSGEVGAPEEAVPLFVKAGDALVYRRFRLIQNRAVS